MKKGPVRLALQVSWMVRSASPSLDGRGGRPYMNEFLAVNVFFIL